MKSTDEIKKGLECCTNDECREKCVKCPYFDGMCGNDLYAVEKDALALIQQLQDDNAQQARCIENMTDKLNAMNDEVAKLQAERDAAVECIDKLMVILKEYPYAATNCCAYGAYMEIQKYIDTVRGVQKEE